MAARIKLIASETALSVSEQAIRIHGGAGIMREYPVGRIHRDAFVYVIGEGTQHVPDPKRNERGVPMSASGTLMVKGDLKGMNARYLRGVSIVGYGCSLAVGLGIPIPILNEEMA